MFANRFAAPQIALAGWLGLAACESEHPRPDVAHAAVADAAIAADGAEGRPPGPPGPPGQSGDGPGNAPPFDGGPPDAGKLDTPAGPGDTGLALDGGSGGPEAAPAPPPSESDELYDPDRIPHFEIDLPPASVAALAADPTSYVPGTFRYGTEVVTNIGVRIKGEATLRTLDKKAAFKLKFDEFVPNRSFRGLRRMTLNNMTEDATFLAERLAYHVFRAAGLPAPRANSALVTVNGSLYGLYANVETEDKTFVRRWFTDDSGNLYEEGQQDFLPGKEASFDLETNGVRNDRSDLSALIGAIAAATGDSLLTDVGRQLDFPHFLRFTAAEAIVNQWDMYAYTRFYPNNFRIYRDPAQDKFVFLPWGMDMALKDFRGQGDHIGIFALAHQYNQANRPITAGLIFRLCLRSPACKAAYATALRDLLALFEKLNLPALAERYRAQIRPHVLADPRKEVSVADFEKMYALMLRIMRERPARIRADLGN